MSHVELTDEQRVEVVREIWEFGYLNNREPFAAMNEYERQAKERLRSRDTLPSPAPEEHDAA